MSRKKKILIVGAGIATGVVSYLLWVNRRLFMVSDVTSGESPAYPDLRSRVYYTDPGSALAVAEQTIKSLPRWRVVHSDNENHTIEGEVESVIGRLLDDITLIVEPLGENRSRVTIRSRSRQGHGDLGQNAQHIRALQNAMDAKLNSWAAF